MPTATQRSIEAIRNIFREPLTTENTDNRIFIVQLIRGFRNGSITTTISEYEKIKLITIGVSLNMVIYNQIDTTFKSMLLNEVPQMISILRKLNPWVYSKHALFQHALRIQTVCTEDLDYVLLFPNNLLEQTRITSLGPVYPENKHALEAIDQLFVDSLFDLNFFSS